jgi:2-amino-4-hydroxy-6-hydroxymethyldihydropteridine diphosphokinase
MTQVTYLSLGSNMGDRAANLLAALSRLARVGTVETISDVFSTAPVGVVDQAPFLNLAVGFATNLAPLDLLAASKDIEREVGREPTFRWGPRVIDIDILLYDGLQFEAPTLTIPHVEMTHRAFVLVPLAQIAPRVLHPGEGRTISELAQRYAGTEDVVPYDRRLRTVGES